MHPSEGRVLTNPLLWVVSREAGIRVGRRLECARSGSLGCRAFSSRGAASTSEGKWHVLHVGVKAPGIPTKSDMPLEPPITSASFICRPSALTSTIASGSMSPGWISCDTSLTSLFCRNWPKSFPALLTTPIVAGGVRMLAQVAARSSGEILMPMVDCCPSVALDASPV